ncbi:MAG: DUF1330 domain-containing protein [Pseudomonadota bacterium]
MFSIDPTRPQFEAFKALPRDTQIDMLNLIRLRPSAAYPDGRAATGAEAYAQYGRHSGPVFARVGGVIAWRGRPETILIGPEEERWDVAFVARYPSAAAFLQMVTDETYQRDAVLQLMRPPAAPGDCPPQPPGDGAGFAGDLD